MKALLFSFIISFALGIGFSQQQPLLLNQEISPEVLAVFPSSDTLPENLLRMYVHFSKPMKAVGNLANIRLVDEFGNEVVGAIYDNAYELWNHEQTQLTLLLDPSRVKSGLISHETYGRALQKGKKYTLAIGPLEDVKGYTSKRYSKSFYVGHADRQAPDQNLWVVHPPKAGGRGPLVVRFPQMLDRLSLLQRLKLANAQRQPVAGEVKIANHETGWRFQPHGDWAAGTYLLYIHSRLEDPAGNNLNGLFDHKPGGLKNTREGVIETIKITVTD